MIIMILVAFMPVFAFGNATAVGDAAVQIIYQEGYEVTSIVMNDQGMVPANVKIAGKPNSSINLLLPESVIVVQENTGKKIVVRLNKNGKLMKIDEESNLEFSVKPTGFSDLPKGNYKGNYNLGISY